MTTQLKGKEKSKVKETRKITFKHQYYGKTKPLDVMRTLTRFFPTVMACHDCARKMS